MGKYLSTTRLLRKQGRSQACVQRLLASSMLPSCPVPVLPDSDHRGCSGVSQRAPRDTAPAPSNSSQRCLHGTCPQQQGPVTTARQGGSGCPCGAWGQLHPGHMGAPEGPPDPLCPPVPSGHPWCPPARPRDLCSDTPTCPQDVPVSALQSPASAPDNMTWVRFAQA